MSKKHENLSSSDSDTSSDSDSDDSTYQKFKEIAVSADFIKKTASKAQNSQNRKETNNNNQKNSTKTNKIDHLQNFNGSGKFDNEIPAGFEKIVSEKIAAWLVEKLSNKYDFSTTLVTKNAPFYENFQKDYHKRIKYGIRFLENGEKVGSKQMKLVEEGEDQKINPGEESSQSSRNKRKSAGQLLNDKLKKKSGTKNESDVSACVVDFDYKRKKFS